MKSRINLLIISVMILAAITFASTHAQSGGGYNLAWNTIDNGGSEIGYGGYTLNGTIGQPDANTPLSNGGYTLTGGFWFSAVTQQRLYLPLVLKSG